MQNVKYNSKQDTCVFAVFFRLLYFGFGPEVGHLYSDFGLEMSLAKNNNLTRPKDQKQQAQIQFFRTVQISLGLAFLSLGERLGRVRRHLPADQLPRQRRDVVQPEGAHLQLSHPGQELHHRQVSQGGADRRREDLSGRPQEEEAAEADGEQVDFIITHSILTAKQLFPHFLRIFRLTFQILRPEHSCHIKFASCYTQRTIKAML